MICVTVFVSWLQGPPSPDVQFPPQSGAGDHGHVDDDRPGGDRLHPLSRGLELIGGSGSFLREKRVPYCSLCYDTMGFFS